MTGIFDSGRGGINTLSELRRLLPREDIVLLSDRKNAPYGIKTEAELIKIAEANIDCLVGLGAERVLIGCCTASAIYPYLDEKYKKIAIPIINPIAYKAKSTTRCGKIGIIATDRTTKSRAFERAISNYGRYEIYSVAMGWLVNEIEGGLCDDSFSPSDKNRLKEDIQPLISKGIDTLILGCTHFPSVSGLISEIVGKNITLISSSYEGAKFLRKKTSSFGNSITKYIVT